MRTFGHFIQIIKLGFFIKLFFSKQKIYNNQFVDAYIASFYKSGDKPLSTETYQKIKKYYCLGIPITCAVYARIYGQTLTEKEQELAVLTGILTPILDDFTDEGLFTSEALNQLTKHPNTFAASTPTEVMVCSTGSRLLNEVSDPAGFAHALEQTMQAQHWSTKQMHANTTPEELAKISLEKGAWSHILFHYIIKQHPTAETIAVMHHMGGMLQWSNDIFDVHKDFEAGIRTFANTCSNYAGLYETYLLGCQKFCTLARQLPFHKKNLEFFIRFFVLVMARGMVALKQLQKLHQLLGEEQIPIAKLNRKQLICDMEKPVNQLRTIKYALKILTTVKN